VQRVALAHRDPARLGSVDLTGPLPPLGNPPTGPLAAALTGQEAVLLESVDPDKTPADPLTAAHYELFRRLGGRSAVIAPLRARGRVLGALTVAREAVGGYRRQDVTLVEDLARRAALAVDNARLYGLQRRAAETLQRSLLTDPPQPDGLVLRVHYRPAAEEARLGGDWYDAFLIGGPEGGDGWSVLAFAIGDVAGHDVPAAAEMAQLRSLLRGAAIDGDSPDRVLTRLDRAARALRVADLATAIYGRLQLAPAPGGGRQVSWSVAGHPAPLLVGPGRRAGYLTGPIDPPVGVAAERRHTSAAVLPAGGTLLLYTDGLVETRDRPVERGMAELADVAAATGPDPDRLIAAVLDALADAPEDDVALLAIAALPAG
jgi:sigma-B regulation protein RsbU (phosphoserine phosphatase)